MTAHLVHHRLRGLFHRGTHADQVQSDRSIPVLHRRFSRRALRSPLPLHITDQSTESFARANGGSGRGANRIRRPKRRLEAQSVGTDRLKFLNLNVQGWNWARIDNFMKTRSIVELLRSTGTDVATFSEVHNGDKDDTDIVYIEEFVFLIGKTISIVLGPKGRARWEAAGSVVVQHGPRILQADLDLGSGAKLHVMAFYQKTGASSIELEEFHGHWREQHEKLGEFQIWAGDTNAHLGADFEGDGAHVGSHKLDQKTSMQGRRFSKYLMNYSLALVDSFMKCTMRGTWFHRHFKSWYENDVSLCSFGLRKKCQWVKTHAATGISDHAAKIYLWHIGSPQKKG